MEIIVYGVYKSKAIEHPDVFAYTRTLDSVLSISCNLDEDVYKRQQMCLSLVELRWQYIRLQD